MSPGSYGFVVLSVVFALPSGAADLASEARAAVAAPFKVAVKPPGQGMKSGEPVDIGVQLQNGKSQPAAARTDTNIQLEVIGNSGEVVKTEKCSILAGSSDATCSIQAPHPGIYQLRALPERRRLLEGSGFLLVVPNRRSEGPAQSDQAGPAAPASVAPGKARAVQRSAPPQAFLSDAPLFIRAAYQIGEAGGAPPAPVLAHSCDSPLATGPARIALRITEGGEDGGAFRAAVESATITAFFQSDDGGAAPRDIHVWLSPDHGSLDPAVLVIPKCSYSAETKLSSKYPVTATVSYAIAPSIYPVDGAPRLVARFLRSVVTVHIEPNGPQTLSLIDREPFVAELLDVDGKVVPADSERNLKFVSDSSIAGPREESISLKTGEFAAENLVLPFSPGKATISVTADRLQTAVHEVDVVGAAVYGYCLIGGLLGGLISSLNAGGFKPVRVVTGVVSGIILAWAYVFGLVPRVDSSVAHNYLSVLVVSILGGYAGTKVFDFVLQRLGWGL